MIGHLLVADHRFPLNYIILKREVDNMSNNDAAPANNKKKISVKRKIYIVRLILRCLVGLMCGYAAVFHREMYDILFGWNFFSGFSVLQILWLIWMVDMAIKLIPKKSFLPIGAQKNFEFCFVSAEGKPDKEKLTKYMKRKNKKAAVTMLIWLAGNAIPAVLYYTGVIDHIILFMICIGYYISDLICVLIWCPFRYLTDSRCCTNCRIFNWDHFFMFTPLLFIMGFYPLTLFAAGLAVIIVWEIGVAKHPERFWEGTNKAIRCTECTDKLCTQFCPKANKNKNK